MSSIHSVNARGGMSLVVDRAYFKMNPAQFRSWVGAHHTTLVDELARAGVSYDALSPALVPSTDRQEMALLFNVDLMDTGFYGYAVATELLPLLGKDSTLSILAGDLGHRPEAIREMSIYGGFVPGATDNWGQQYIYCVYLNNLSTVQRDQIHQRFLTNSSYLGYVPTTYSSNFRTLVSTELPTAFIKHRRAVLLDHGGDEPWVSDQNEIGYPFQENGLKVVSVNSQLHSPLLSYKIQSDVLPMYEEDVLVSLNAISDEPLKLDDFEVVFPDGKFGYLQSKKLGLLKVAGLDELSPEALAAVIRAELGNDYIYRMQTNPDDTVQFSMVLELYREDGTPAKVAVGLKYFPSSKTLNFVTLT
ncbi:MAG: hypothetical protein ACOH19_16930 [Rhodoglobus sp.]